MDRRRAREIVEVVLDGRLWDGSEASDDDRRAELARCVDEDAELARLLIVARYGDHVDGTAASWDERERALTEIERRVASRPEPPVSPAQRDAREELAEGGDASRDRRRHVAGASLFRPRKTIDERAVRTLLDDGARAAGWDSKELFAPLPRGRLTSEQQERRSVLAGVLQAAQRAGASQVSIAKAVGLSPQRVSDLLGDASRLPDSA